jgi:hypothetical protein
MHLRQMLIGSMVATMLPYLLLTAPNDGPLVGFKVIRCSFQGYFVLTISGTRCCWGLPHYATSLTTRQNSPMGCTFPYLCSTSRHSTSATWIGIGMHHADACSEMCHACRSDAFRGHPSPRSTSLLYSHYSPLWSCR